MPPNSDEFWWRYQICVMFTYCTSTRYKTLMDHGFMAHGCALLEAHWLEKYRTLPKILNAFKNGKESAACNLCQNPSRHPVAGIYCPALLRNGKMLLILRSPEKLALGMGSPSSALKNHDDAGSYGVSDGRGSLGTQNLEITMVWAEEHLQMLGVPQVPGVFGGPGISPYWLHICKLLKEPHRKCSLCWGDTYRSS